jgi:hypothetical protein
VRLHLHPVVSDECPQRLMHRQYDPVSLAYTGWAPQFDVDHCVSHIQGQLERETKAHSAEQTRSRIEHPLAMTCPRHAREACA